MHRVVISSIRNRPPEIGVYLGLLTVILGFLYSVIGLCKIGAVLRCGENRRQWYRWRASKDEFFCAQSTGPDARRAQYFE